MGTPGIIHNHMPDSWAWMQPHIPDLTAEHSFYSQAMWVIYVLGFLHVIHRCLYNQALADVRSTGVGIKCTVCLGFLMNTGRQLHSQHPTMMQVCIATMPAQLPEVNIVCSYSIFYSYSANQLCPAFLNECWPDILEVPPYILYYTLLNRMQPCHPNSSR